MEACASMRPRLPWLYLRFPFKSFFKIKNSKSKIKLWLGNLNNLIWALCVCIEEGKGIQREWYLLSVLCFFPLQSFPGRLWHQCSCKLLKGKGSHSSTYKLGMLLNRWPGLEYMATAFTNWLEEHQEKKESQCCIWQSKKPPGSELKCWSLFGKVLRLIFYRGHGRMEGSSVICFACGYTPEYLKALHVHICCDCMLVMFYKCSHAPSTLVWWRPKGISSMLAMLWLICLLLLFVVTISEELNVLFLALSVSLPACFTSDAMQC